MMTPQACGDVVHVQDLEIVAPPRNSIPTKMEFRIAGTRRMTYPPRITVNPVTPCWSSSRSAWIHLLHCTRGRTSAQARTGTRPAMGVCGRIHLAHGTVPTPTSGWSVCHDQKAPHACSRGFPSTRQNHARRLCTGCGRSGEMDLPGCR